MKKLIILLGLSLFITLVSFNTNNKKIIVIDAAHGGYDLGATFNEATEKDIVEKISKKIFEKNDPSKIEIILLRDTDNFISLEDRAEKINKLNADLLISLHINKTQNKDSRGVEVFISEKNKNYDQSQKYAQKLMKNLSTLKLKERGISNGNYLILRTSNCATVLLELGFISNENDRNYITSEEGQNEIAENILKSIQ